MDRTEEDLSGQELDGKWKLLAPIGSGSWSTVYRARHRWIPSLDAAVKLLGANCTLDERRRFLAEATAACRASHPGIVQIHDCGMTPSGRPYLVMERVAGVTLRDALMETPGHRFDLGRVLQIGRQMAEALEAAHSHAVVHRDLKGSNVMLVPARPGSTETVKVLDFGIAKVRGNLNPITCTMPGTIMGTYPYMSPEQWRTQHDIDGRADIYSLGVMLYQMVAGRFPFEARAVADWALKHIQATVPVPSGMASGPAWLILRMLEKRREARPQSMREVATALQAMIDVLADSRSSAERASLPIARAQTQDSMASLIEDRTIREEPSTVRRIKGQLARANWVAQV